MNWEGLAMIHKKKRWAVLLLALLVFSIQIPVNAASMSTAVEKAEALARINILKGSNGDYRLNDQISRSEAATFIVRLLGKEDYVLANADLFRKTNFTDVPETSWFAPYVGYLTSLGYIAGVTPNSFQPNAFITEKAFIKITLCALNYIPEVDFKWDGIYRKAVEVGLVTDVYYIVRTEDNLNYTRGQAVAVLYNALTLPLKGTEIKLFQQLIQDGQLSKDDALIAGFIYDTIRTEIVEVIPNDMDEASIRFNEDIAEIGDISIYRSTNPEEKHICTVLSRTPNTFTIETIPQIPLREYIIEATNIKDKEGNFIEKVTQAFHGYISEKVSSTYFRINTIEPENSKSINVIFTQPVNKNSEICLYYRIFENNQLFADGNLGDITVRQLGSNPNGVLLTLANKSFNTQATYTLEVNGDLLSAYGAKMNNGAKDEMKFIPRDGEVESFSITEIYTSDSETIAVEFNKEINSFIAQQIYNFYVTDVDGKPIQVEKTTVEQAGNDQGRVLYIKIKGSFEKGKVYHFTINYLNDITRQEYISEQVFSFTAQYSVNEALGVSALYYHDNQTLEFIFNKPLDPATASNSSYYTIKNKKSNKTYNPVKVYHNTQSMDRVKLYFSSAEAFEYQTQYELQINEAMKDYTGKTLGRTYRLSFEGESNLSKTPFNYSGLVPVSTEAIKITFNKEFALEESIIKPENYILEYYYQGMKIEKNPVGVLFIDAKTIILRFDQIAYDTDYTLRIQNIRDYAGQEKNGISAIPFNLKSELYASDN